MPTPEWSGFSQDANALLLWEPPELTDDDTGDLGCWLVCPPGEATDEPGCAPATGAGRCTSFGPADREHAELLADVRAV